MDSLPHCLRKNIDNPQTIIIDIMMLNIVLIGYLLGLKK